MSLPCAPVRVCARAQLLTVLSPCPCACVRVRAQLYAMKYGAVPVAHSTGGLKDTVIDVTTKPDGTGWTYVTCDAGVSARVGLLWRLLWRCVGGTQRDVRRGGEWLCCVQPPPTEAHNMARNVGSPHTTRETASASAPRTHRTHATHHAPRPARGPELGRAHHTHATYHAPSQGLSWATRTALETYYEDREGFRAIQRRGMERDASWDLAAQQYEQIMNWAVTDAPFCK